jgi:hypothetical protein
VRVLRRRNAGIKTEEMAAISAPKKQVSESVFDVMLLEYVRHIRRQYKETPEEVPERLDDLGFHVGERLAERFVFTKNRLLAL